MECCVFSPLYDNESELIGHRIANSLFENIFINRKYNKYYKDMIKSLKKN
jgi:hypothetical protein